MNNLSSYCGLVDAKIRASDKDLPVRLFKRFVYLEISAKTVKSVSKVSHSILHSCETIRYPPGRHPSDKNEISKLKSI